VEEINSLIGGFKVALSWYNVALMMVGILLGVIIGVLPGLGGANGVAILLPLTFTMPPTSAIIMLSCIYWGALFGGAITSILFNIPGEPWSVATTFDGHPMAQRGKADEALTAAFTSSFVGALFAVILITFLAPLIAKFALQFGPAEFFSVFFLTFASFVGMGRGSPFKVLASMCLGFALASVGLDKMTGTLRMTFGYDQLLVGFDGDVDVGADVSTGLSPLSLPIVAIFGTAFGGIGTILENAGFDLWTPVLSTAFAALIAGGMWIVMMNVFVKTQAETKVDLNEVVGHKGQVMVPIKPGHPGQVVVITEARGRTLLQAIAEEDIGTDEHVVVDAVVGNSVKVHRA